MEAVKVLYCAVCGLPPEYCEYGPDFEKCKPWLKENAPHAYPHLFGSGSESSAAEHLNQLKISDGGEEKKSDEAKSNSQSSEIVQRLPGGRVKKKEKKEVYVEKVTRNKRKSVTTIKGLDFFGIKLSDAAKKFGKKFASGSSVVKGPTEKEQIDVQGDILIDCVEFITKTWPEVPESAIFLVEDGKKISM